MNVLRNCSRVIRWSVVRLMLPRNHVYFRLKGITAHADWKIQGLPLVQRAQGATIQIGTRFVCCSDPKKNSVSLVQKVALKAGRRDATILIGDNVGVSGATISARSSIKIGDNVLIGSGCLISDSDAHPLRYEDRSDDSKIRSAPIVIEDNCFIGARSIILKGVTVGSGSVIGAGSVVVRDIPPGVVAAGNPARVVRRLADSP